MNEQIRRWRRWLAPGLGIKRWALVIGIGILVFGAGVSLLANVGVLGAFEAATFRFAGWVYGLSGGRISTVWVGSAGAVRAPVSTAAARAQHDEQTAERCL